MHGLTPELSRPAARRQSSTNIPEKFAAVKQGRLGRIVRPAPDVFAGTAAGMANLPLERLDDIDLIPAVRRGMRSEFASMAATQRGERPGAGTAEPAWMACPPERCCGQRLRSTSSAATAGAGDTENCHIKLFVCDIPTQPHPFYKYRAGLTPELSRAAKRLRLE